MKVCEDTRCHFIDPIIIAGHSSDILGDVNRNCQIFESGIINISMATNNL